jgi:Uncharacterized protein conserved in bacteria (DUF2188)
MPEVHVVPDNPQWGVILGGTPEYISLHSRKEDALRDARDLASRQGARLVVHDRKGRVISQVGR